MTRNWDPFSCLFPGFPNESPCRMLPCIPHYFADLLDGPLSCDRVPMDSICGHYRAHRNLELLELFPGKPPLAKPSRERTPQPVVYLKITPKDYEHRITRPFVPWYGAYRTAWTKSLIATMLSLRNNWAGDGISTVRNASLRI